MGTYRRLNKKHAEKLDKYKLVRKKISKLVKWTSVLSVIAVLLGGAIVSFYLFVDSRQNGDISVKSSDYVGSVSSNKTGISYDQEDDKKIEGDVTLLSDEVGQKELEERKYDFSEWNSKCKKEMCVINKDNPIPEGMSIKTKICRGKEVGIEISANLDKMISDAKKDGVMLWLSSGYRSMELQTKLFNRQIERAKNKGLSDEDAVRSARRVVAKPGTSEHNTGLAVDFNGVEDSFYKTKEYEWLIEHASEYGFIERYPKDCEEITGVIYEPWHFRYVGVDNAKKIKESGLCLEEYVYKIEMNK